MTISTSDIREMLRALPMQQQTSKSLRYARYKSALTEVLAGMTDEQRKKSARLNKDFMRGLREPKYRPSYEADMAKGVATFEKTLTPQSVHQDTALTTLSVMYANAEYIGEQLMPAVSVAKRSDVYYIYDKRDRLAYPEDEITGAKSNANELDQNRSTANYSVRGYGYKNHLAFDVLQNQDAPLNEMVDVVEQINEGIAFRREKRILAIVGSSSNYGSNTAAAATVWSDATGGSIRADLLAARAALWSGFGPTRKIGFCSLEVWNEGIADNPEIHDLFNAQGAGLPTTQIVANWFRLDDILVSEARQDTANIGQTASYGRMLTDKVFGILSVAQSPTVRSAHFGSTFRLQGTPVSTQWLTPDVGVSGGMYARVAVLEDHKVVAGDAGYLVTSAVS